MLTMNGTVMHLTRCSVEMILVGVSSSFSVFLYCGPSYICSRDLHLCCWSIPSSQGDRITVMSFLNKLEKITNACQGVQVVMFIYLCALFTPVISSYVEWFLFWSWCFVVWAFELFVFGLWCSATHTQTHTAHFLFK